MNIQTIDDIKAELQKQYHNVYEYIIEDTYYLYRLLNKEEYAAMISTDLDALELEDAIVYTCVLYPNDIDTDEMVAGEVSELATKILQASCIDLESRLQLLEEFSEQMKDLDDMMICIIMEAFQGYKLDELEKYDFPTLYKLYTRAEWALINLRGVMVPVVLDPIESIKIELRKLDNPNDEVVMEIPQPQQQPQQRIEEQTGKYMGRKLDEVMGEISKPVETPESKRKPMSPEQVEALNKFQQQFPEMKMQYDAMFTGAESMSADTVAPALRVPGKR